MTCPLVQYHWPTACPSWCDLQGHVYGEGVWAVLAALLQQVILPLLAAGVVLTLVVKNGKALVRRPQLCPTLSHPW